MLGLVAALLLWWRGRESNGSGDSKAVARAGAEPSGKGGARAIDADEEGDETPRSKLPWNRPGTSISGRVIDETGKPIAKADVCAIVMGSKLPNHLARDPICAQTGADGKYMIAELPPMKVGVAATAATFQPGHYDAPGKYDQVDLRAGEAKQGIDIVLKGGGVLVKGIVKDIAGGVIEGATLKARHGWNWRSAEGISFGKSDDKGEFAMWVAPGDLNITASAEGYANGDKFGDAPGYTFELLLTPESVLIGRVVRADNGKPVADAYVTLESWDWSDNGAYTEADGTFRLDRLEPERYKPVARTAELYGQIAESIRLGLGQTVDGVEIAVHPLAAVRGRIVLAGDTDAPCEQGSVSLNGKISKRGAWDDAEQNGEVEIAALEPDTYEVSVYCEGFVAEAKYPDVVIADASVDGQVWEVKPGLVLRGQVVDQDGKPIARADVSAQPVGTGARAQQTRSWGERTDEEGRFETTGLIAGTYELRASHEDYVDPETPPKITLADGDKVEEQKLELEAGGIITGKVIDANKRPVPGATVRVMGKKWWGGGEGHTGDDGTFTMKAVRPGSDLRVVAQRGWSNEMRAPGTNDDDIQGERIDVRAGETSTVELVVEEQFGKISGKVVDADGAPVDDAFVHTTRESDSAAANAKGTRANVRWGAWNRTPSLTEQDGSFALDKLEVGKHTVMAMRKGGGEGVVEHVETGSSGITIRLAEGGTISGKVALSSGGSPKRFSISLEGRSQGVWRTEEFFQTSGVFTIADLPAGKYTVGVTATEGSSDTEIELAEGAKKSGVDLVLTPKVDVTGTVVDLKTGEPVPGMKVSISPKKGGGFSFSFGGGGGEMEDVSDESGKFKVAAAPAGAVRIMVMPRNFMASEDEQYGWQNMTRNIPGDNPSVDIGQLRVAKSRTKMGDRGGDFGLTIKEGDPEAEYEDVPLEIAVIRPGSPAADSELKIGDVIVEVDGEDVTGENRYLYHTLTHVKQGEKVTFGTQGGKKVTLVAGKPV
ncbi:MAG TPA: carboxypeptidase regulatory-like domain-containing protein [Nannocystaceae bacterium]|nr:carboxypeptidase regulatory-like domain-containing protein [Nannocystaceae bacterium]